MTKGERKKILFVIPSLAGGGAERVLLDILTHLNREKFTPHLALFEKKGEYLDQISKDVTVYDLNKRNRVDFFKLIFLLAYKIYPDIKPDIVVSFLDYTNLVTLVSKGLSFVKPKVIITEHGNLARSHKNERRKNIRGLFTRTFYPLSDKIIAVSQGTMRDLKKNFNIPTNKAKVIYNGVNVEAVTKLAQEGVDGYGFRDKSVPVITACGRLTDQKNYSLLLKAFAKINKRVKANLIILGEGRKSEFLENLIKDLELCDSVFLPGFQMNPFKYIAKSDVFVLSSSWEGFGKVIIEAMACRVSVVSTDCPYGPNEIITENVDGLLVPVGDTDAMAEAILKLLKDELLRKRLAEAGRKRAEDFRVEKMIAEYERVFEEYAHE